MFSEVVLDIKRLTVNDQTTFFFNLFQSFEWKVGLSFS